jgi:hypothetical protein
MQVSNVAVSGDTEMLTAETRSCCVVVHSLPDTVDGYSLGRRDHISNHTERAQRSVTECSERNTEQNTGMFAPLASISALPH